MCLMGFLGRNNNFMDQSSSWFLGTQFMSACISPIGYINAKYSYYILEVD